MPVYWVEQEQGAVADQIHHALDGYREGAWSAATTWGMLADAYQKVTHRRAPQWMEHQHHVEYMLTTWFPRYANYWHSGSLVDCQAEALRLQGIHSGRFRVCYEY